MNFDITEELLESIEKVGEIIDTDFDANKGK